MDICNPPLLWLDSRCYRLTESLAEDCVVEAGYTGEFESFRTETDDEPDCYSHNIEQLDSGNFKAVLEVASPFFAQIIGKGGQTKVRLENDTKTKINIPRKGKEGDITVTGMSRAGVAQAANRIDVIVATARQKQPFTHFLSIPVNTASVQENFLRFKSSVLETVEDVYGLDETIFQTETLLHLTVGTMALLDERERDLARQILMECKETIIKPLLGDRTLEFSIEGLEIMNDDPGDVDVLYGKVHDDSGALQSIVDGLVEEFVQRGLMRREHERVKLHVTLLNTLFRKDQGDLGDRDRRERESFDGRMLLEKFSGLSLGSVELSELHLSQRRAGRRTNSGYYLPSAVLSL